MARNLTFNAVPDISHSLRAAQSETFATSETAHENVTSLLEYVMTDLANGFGAGVLPRLKDGLEKDAHDLVMRIVPNYLVKICAEPKRTYLLPNRSPDYERNPAQDIADYIGIWTQAYRDLIQCFASSLGPMQSSCQSSICIPVAAHEEHHYIFDTLQSFVDQTADRESFELILFANYPESRAEFIHETHAAIERFVDLYPEFPVKVFSGTFSKPEDLTIGLLRSIVHDVALLRHAERHNGLDHLLIRCDADTRGVDREYINNFHNRAERYTRVDAFIGQTRWSAEQYAYDPLFYMNQLFDELVTTAKYRGEHDYTCGGPNVAMRASSYSLVGGYRTSSSMGEDIEIHKRLKKFREGSSQNQPFARAGSRSRLYTSSRRAREAFLEGASSLSQWSIEGTKFGSENPRVRCGAETTSERVRVQYASNLAESLEGVLNRSIHTMSKFWSGFNAYSKPIEIVLRKVLGARYTVSDEGILFLERDQKFLNRYTEAVAESIRAQQQRRQFLFKSNHTT